MKRSREPSLGSILPELAPVVFEWWLGTFVRFRGIVAIVISLAAGGIFYIKYPESPPLAVTISLGLYLSWMAILLFYEFLEDLSKIWDS